MFYCNKCGIKRDWPVWTMARSSGQCEICKEKRIMCNDVPSYQLPSATPEMPNPPAPPPPREELNEEIDWQAVSDNIADRIKCNGSITGEEVESIKIIHTTYHHLAKNPHVPIPNKETTTE